MASMTIVFKVDDEAAFRASADYARIFELFKAEPGTVPFRVSALSHDDEVHRVQLIDEARERYEHDGLSEAIEYVQQHPNLAEFSWDVFEAE